MKPAEAIDRDLDAIGEQLTELQRKLAEYCAYYIEVPEEEVLEENRLAARMMLEFCAEELGMDFAQVRFVWFRSEAPSEQAFRKKLPRASWKHGRITSLGRGRLRGQVSPMKPDPALGAGVFHRSSGYHSS